MSTVRLTDAQIATALRLHVPRPQAGLREQTLDAIATTAQQRALPSVVGRLMDADPVARRRSLLIAAALLIALSAAVAVGVGALVEQEDPPAIPLVWTPGALEQDWPGAVRIEPAGEAVVVPWTTQASARTTFADALGDIGPASPGWMDVATVELGWCRPSCGIRYMVWLAADMPLPLVRPSQRWIAYGIVLDLDEDGVADVRMGIDNMPPTPGGDEGHRVWRTDLRTGTTSWQAGPPYGGVSSRQLDTWFPGEGLGNLAKFVSPEAMQFRSYAWAAVIEDGAVVAVDYAPDAGWFDPTP